jgi:hypothetical protein
MMATLGAALGTTLMNLSTSGSSASSTFRSVVALGLCAVNHTRHAVAEPKRAVTLGNRVEAVAVNGNSAESYDAPRRDMRAETWL